MTLDAATDGFKSWWDNRVKSPYFFNVIVVWLVLNKGLIFAVFNFTEKDTFYGRYKWTKDYLQSFHLSFFDGFYGSIIAAMLLAPLSMMVLNILNGAAASLYHWSTSISSTIESA